MSSQAVRKTDSLLAMESPGFSPERPIDFVHLSRQTLGDRDLEVELLGLFERQAAQIMERLAASGPDGDRRWRRDLAHTLKGSACAIGAGRVAETADIYEAALFAPTTDTALADMLADMGRAVEQARAFAREFLAEA